MKNKSVGLLIIGISIVIGFIIFMFNFGMKDIVEASCDHGRSCGMYGTIQTQTGISAAIAILILFIGIFIFFSSPEEKIVEKEIIKKIKIKEKKKVLNLEGLESDEKELITLLQSEGKAMFQSDLMEKMSMGKVKTTRLLDKLESKQFIERKRRGMNNIVVLRD